MTLNLGISSYSLIGYRLEFVNAFVDLVILMDSKFNFINHLIAIIFKAKSSLGFLKRGRNSMIRPQDSICFVG